MSEYGRRAGDGNGWRRVWHWWTETGSQVFLIVIAGFVLLAVIDSNRAVSNQNKGRRAANAVTCATASAIIDAGRQTFLTSSMLPGDRRVNGRVVSGKLGRFLEAHGYPGPLERQQGAALAAHQYAQFIAERVIGDTHVQGLVKPNGSLDCSRLLKIARL